MVHDCKRHHDDCFAWRWIRTTTISSRLVLSDLLGDLWICNGKSFRAFDHVISTNARQQFLLAAGLQYEKSSRATNMVYMQMLFALSFDKLIWGTTPGALSIVGSSLILGSAIYVAMHKENPTKAESFGERGDHEEGRGLMATEFIVDQDAEGQGIRMVSVRT